MPGCIGLADSVLFETVRKCSSVFAIVLFVAHFVDGVTKTAIRNEINFISCGAMQKYLLFV